MFQKTRGIVLRETEYKESDKILTLLTADYGQMTVKARGVRRRTSKLSAACGLFAYAEFTIFENRGFRTVNEADPIELFPELASDLELLALASYFTQMTETLSQEDSPDPALLSLLLNALYALGKLHKPQEQVKAAFELRLAAMAGYEPDLSGCAVCGSEMPDRFNVRTGSLLCSSCESGAQEGLRLPVCAGTLDAMRYILACEPARLYAFRLSEAGAAELSGITETYLLTQLERGFFTLDFYKSLKLT